MKSAAKEKRIHSTDWRNANTTRRGRIKKIKNRAEKQYVSKYYKSKSELLEQIYHDEHTVEIKRFLQKENRKNFS